MTKTAKPTAGTPASDPATAREQLLKRQRERMARTLLKRRRRKSHQ